MFIFIKSVKGGNLSVDSKKVLKIEAYTMSNKLIVSSADFSVTNIDIRHKNMEQVVLKADIKNPVSASQKIKIIVYMLNGDRLQYTTSVDLCTTFQLNAMIDENFVILEERRRFYKVKVKLKAMVVLVSDEDKEIIVDKPFNVIIRDINIGGIYIESSNIRLKVNDIINIQLNLCDRDMVLCAKILRCQNVGMSNEGYGCSFINIKNSQEEQIAKYINKIQRERMDEIKVKLENR